MAACTRPHPTRQEPAQMRRRKRSSGTPRPRTYFAMAGLLARGSSPSSAFPGLRPVACFGCWLTAYSCGGSAGVSPASLFAPAAKPENHDTLTLRAAGAGVKSNIKTCLCRYFLMCFSSPPSMRRIGCEARAAFIHHQRPANERECPLRAGWALAHLASHPDWRCGGRIIQRKPA